MRTRAWGFMGALAIGACAGAGGGAVESAPAMNDAGSPLEPASCPAPRDAALEAAPHFIAYDDRGVVRMIDIADPNSTPQTLIEGFDPGESLATLEPGWSADGRWFAFTANLEAGYAVYAVEVTGGAIGPAQPVVRAAYERSWFDEFRWAPRGAWLAYVEHEGDSEAPRSKLMLRDLSASEPIVALEGERLTQLRWSPDGSKLWLRDQETSLAFVVRVEDEIAAHELGLDESDWPIWSPDSRFVARFEDTLRVYDTEADPPHTTKFVGSDRRSAAGIRWSDDGRFFVMQRYVDTAEGDEEIVLVAFDTRDLQAEPKLMKAVSPHGETSFALGDAETLQPPDFTFVPGEHAIVTATEAGWTYAPLRDELGEPRVLAALDAGIAGFSDARELLWLDGSGLYATPLDGGEPRSVYRFDEAQVRDEHAFHLGQNISVAPLRDRLVVARTGSSSAFDLVATAGCTPTPVAFDLPHRFSGVFTPHGYPWAWLRDGRGLLQQTESASHAGVVEDASQEVARLELVRAVEGRLETRTLLEVPLDQQSLAFAFEEQP